ncbi:glycosyltransferase family 4 protein [Glycomyces harbinensis]|uniref:Glycosyltransferase involved in cell wall bisynthesis n=1 Tax=Glycomyces harbinensis TaxID=58114 RepID=A0A1G6ZQ28_9ACTN|nr:glycosyltransferase family 4 protein [Glycomyces harbinensis]SDE04493.1 Glycosyltransferase involved in cell wall bisynthesis [Glycomyces harbinensis]
MSHRRIALVLGPSTGGIGTHVASLAAGLVERGDAVLVVGPPETEERFGFRAKGARFAPAPITAKPSPELPLAWWAARGALRGITGRGVDLVHAHGLTAGLTALAARPTGAALVTTWHNQLITEGIKRRVSDEIEKRLARGVDVALAASSDLHEHLVDLGARDARLAPVAAPPRRATGEPEAIRTELGIGDRPLLLSVGRLHPQKDYDTLIAAATRWRGLEPAPVVAIAGDGPERERLQGLIDASGADVRLLGHRTDVGDLLAAADLTLVTSQWEARQLFAQEALQAGVPLVTTRTGGIPELVGDAALYFEVGDVDGLDQVVRGLLADPVRLAAHAEASLARAATWPDEAQMLDALDALYLELTGR